MFFNSIPFVVFFVVFFSLYWLVFDRSLSVQNVLVLLGSYVFYAWWDWRFLPLLFVSSVLNYYLGIGIYRNTSSKLQSLFIGIGLIQGIGSLLFFKYFNFFVDTLGGLSSVFGTNGGLHHIHILLPLGISFYTFKTISYLLDVKKGRVTPTTDLVVFLNYVSFFPSIISGPIDRPKTLIPQMENKRTFDPAQAADGLRQILWGLFKKIFIADNCAGFTSDVFAHYNTLPASSLLLGAILATIQIYADFSGYSDMAIGIAGLLGFKITRNFDYPFFAQNIAEFWRRWHISLTSWLTDYVFKPLAMYFRDYGKAGVIISILINFTLIGIWHGPNWTFVLFGFLHGCFYVPLILSGEINKSRKIPNRQLLPSVKMIISMLATFLLVMITFIIFKSGSLAAAFEYYHRLFSVSLFTIPLIAEKVNMAVSLAAIVLMFIAEWLQRDKQHPLQIDMIRPFAARALIYYSIIAFILCFSPTKITDFIYLKF